MNLRLIALLTSMALTYVSQAQADTQPAPPGSSHYSLQVSSGPLLIADPGDPEIEAAMVQANEAALAGRFAEAIRGAEQALQLMDARHELAAKADGLELLAAYCVYSDPARAVGLLSDAIELVKEKGPEQMARLMMLQGSIAIALLKMDRAGAVAAEPLARELYAWSQRQYGESDVITIKALETLTLALVNQSKDLEALSDAQTLRMLSTQVLGSRHWEVARAAGYIGATQIGLGDFQSGVQSLAQSLSIWDEFPDHPSDEYTWTQYLLDMALARAERSGDPDQQLQHAFEACEHTELVNACARIGLTLGRLLSSTQGHQLQALPVLATTVRWAEAAPQPSDTLSYALHGLGYIEFFKGDFANAERHLRRAIELRRSTGDTAALAADLDLLGRTLSAESQHAEAVQLSQAALEMAQSIEAPDSKELLDQLDHTADVYLSADRPADALPLLQRARLLSERLYGLAAPSNYWVAQALVELRNYSEAEAYARTALRVHLQCCGTDSPDVADDSMLLAAILAEHNRTRDKEVERLLRHASRIRRAEHSIDWVLSQLSLSLYLDAKDRRADALSVLKAVEGNVQHIRSSHIRERYLIRREEVRAWIRQSERHCKTRLSAYCTEFGSLSGAITTGQRAERLFLPEQQRSLPSSVQ